ncbi:MAG TPA: putative toxin-antitoxin system toxin component, PIN family [Gaiellaceae bacterium]
MRAVLDPNVLISAALSPGSAPALVVEAWQGGRFELVVSPLLLAELNAALAYPKLRKHISAEDAEQLLVGLQAAAESADDPPGPGTIRSRDPGDDYLLALAEREGAALVSGDRDLLARSDAAPIFAPSAFLELLES